MVIRMLGFVCLVACCKRKCKNMNKTKKYVKYFRALNLCVHFEMPLSVLSHKYAKITFCSIFAEEKKTT